MTALIASPYLVDLAVSFQWPDVGVRFLRHVFPFPVGVFGVFKCAACVVRDMNGMEMERGGGGGVFRSMIQRQRVGAPFFRLHGRCGHVQLSLQCA